MSTVSTMPDADVCARMGALRDQLRPLLAARSEDASANVTDLWRRILDVQDYVFDLSPEHLARIRLHTNYFTRFSPSTFLRFIRDRRDPEMAGPVSQYRFYAEAVPERLWISEPPLAGSPLPTGFPWRGKAVNPEVVRYQACISNLHRAGILDHLRAREHPVVVEIGGGFGGQALALFEVLPDLPLTYIIIDMPNLLLFPGCHLLTNRPQERVMLCRSEQDVVALRDTPNQRRLVLLPIQLNESIPLLPACDLVITMASLQEMSPAQIEHYSASLAERCSGYLYSDNTERHPDNHELRDTSVSAILERHWHLHPSSETYEQVRDLSQPWCHRAYIGTSRTHAAAPPRGSIRFIGGNNKRGERYVCDLAAGTPTVVEQPQ